MQNKEIYEAEIFKEFKKLGYNYISDDWGFKLENKSDIGLIYIRVNLRFCSISCYLEVGDKMIPYPIGKEEFNLLNELFRLQGWWLHE